MARLLASRPAAFLRVAGLRLGAPGRLTRARWGAARVWEGARLVAGNRDLSRAAALPTFLTVTACLALAAWKAATRPPGDGTSVHTFIVAFVALSSMPPTLLQRMWTRVGLQARRAVGATPGEPEWQGEPYLAMLRREGWKAVLQLIAVTAGLAPVYLLLELLPFTRVTLPALAGLWTAYWVVLDALEIPMEVAPGRLGPGAPTWFERLLQRGARRTRFLFFFRPGARFLGWCARPWRHQAKLTERQPWECLGFGLAAGAFLSVPVVGIFFRAVTITAGTSLLWRLRRVEAAAASTDQLPPSSLPTNVG